MIVPVRKTIMMVSFDVQNLLEEHKDNKELSVEQNKEAGTFTIVTVLDGFCIMRGVQKDRNSWIVTMYTKPVPQTQEKP